MENQVEYEKLRLDVLRNLIADRDIDCKNTKDEMIKYLKLYDAGKYIRETTYEKDGVGFIVGIDLKNKTHLVEMGKLVEKKEARSLNQFYCDRVHYWSSQKLT